MSDWWRDIEGTAITQRGDCLYLEPLSETNLDDVWRIEHAAHTHPWSRALLAQCLSGRQRAIVARRADQVVGYAALCRAVDTIELLNIAIDPQHHRQNLGQTLLKHLTTHLAGHVQSLFLEVRRSNSAAIALYRQLGMQQVGERPNYYPASNGCREDALLFTKEIKS